MMEARSKQAPLETVAQDQVLGLEQVRALIRPKHVPSKPLPRVAQVVVVGAGPAGLTAANLLGKLGVDTLLLDTKSATTDQPKAIAIDDEYMRLLAHLGLEPALQGHLSAPFGIWFMGADGRPVIKVQGSRTPNGFGRRCAVMQPVLEQILLEGAASRPSVRVRYDAKVDAIAQSDNAVEVRIGEDVVRCDYLLACDGVRSSIRSALKIKFQGKHIDEPHLVVDLAAFPDRSPFSRFFCDPRRPFNSVPSVYGGRRIEFMLKADDDRDLLLSDEGLRELIDKHTPYKGVQLEVVRRAIYGFSEKIAERLRDGRVFLLGDAAHVMPPFGGQGMNTAARDANNLCWKIAEVLNGSSPERLLDTYDPERRPQIQAIVKYSVLVGRFANIRSKPLAYIRDAFLRFSQQAPSVRRFFGEMRYMPRPRITEGLVETTDPRFKSYVGVTFPRWAIRVGGEPSTIDDLAGGGFCLLGVGIAAAALGEAALHPLWAGRDVSLVTLNSPEAGGAAGVRRAEIEGDSPPGLNHLRGAICVIRPDRYVAAIAIPALAQAVFDLLAKRLAPDKPLNSTSKDRSRPRLQEAVQ